MDPDANLREQKRLAKQMQGEIDSGVQPHPDDVGALCELVSALDEWLCSGGFKPGDWQ